MRDIYIYHHLGLGDHILCNAIVREKAKEYDNVYLFCKPRNVKNVRFMYRDLPNIKLLPQDDKGVFEYMNIFKNNNYLIIGITREWFNKFNSGEFDTFDEGFYKSINMPFKYKWDKFYLKRDINNEKDIYKKINPNSEEFIFVHDDKEMGRSFRDDLIEKGLKIIRLSEHKDIGLFEFLYTIEKAKEVHVMNSSLMCLIDTIQLRNDGLFLHEYARTDMGDNPNPKLKLNWKIIK